MSRLIVVSNRVTAPADPGAGSAGGLAMALASALRTGNGVWFGWSGETTETYTGQLSIQLVGDVTVALVDLEPQDREEYYNGYANRTLWPLFHYRSDLTEYERSFRQGYDRVNERFARALAPLVGPDDVIWVQDYHLIPLGRELRRLGVRNRIGFFLHIPWPSRRTFTTLPGHEILAESLFHYDLVGFQADDHRGAFADYVNYVLAGQTTDDAATAFGRTVGIGVFPIGIDAAEFISSLDSDPAKRLHRRMVESKAGRRMILGVDRLDYSKGLEERLGAYERFLAAHPDRHGDVFFLQVATPSRDDVETYQDLRLRLETQSGRINGAYADLDWVPMRYVSRPYRRDELAGVYRAADIGLVTPLRDGMNLVAKEYVAAQDPEDPGVLILSQFAGAADQLKDALIVNPFSGEAVADAIARALDMSLAERQARWRGLIDGIQKDNVSAWRDDFLKALQAADAQAAAGPSDAVPA